MLLNIAFAAHRGMPTISRFVSLRLPVVAEALYWKHLKGTRSPGWSASAAALAASALTSPLSDTPVSCFSQPKPLDVESSVLSVCGEDRWGRPTLVARPCMHHASTTAESLAAVCSCMETVRRSLERLPGRESQILVLYDLAGAKASNLDMVFSRELVGRLCQEFPDSLGHVLVINGHWTISAAWRSIRMLLHPETRDKVVFCGHNYLDKLLAYIHPDHPYLRHLQSVQGNA